MRGIGAIGLIVGLLASHGAVRAQELLACEQSHFQGRCERFGFGVRNLKAYGFNDRIVSVEIPRGRWLLCEHADFRGECVILRGSVPDLAEFDLDAAVSSLRPLSRRERGGEPAVGIELFEHAGFRGRQALFTAEAANLGRFGWNDIASSLRVWGGAWEVCRHSRFRDCVLIEGDVPNLGALGLNDEISSLRPLGGFERGGLYRKGLEEETD